MEYKIYGISYTSRNFKNRYDAITNNGKNCGLFDEFRCFTEEDIKQDFKIKYKKVWNSPRGGGYWIWKPHIISNMLKQMNMNMNDILVYLDGGSYINITTDSIERFNEYIKMVNN